MGEVEAARAAAAGLGQAADPIAARMILVRPRGTRNTYRGAVTTISYLTRTTGGIDVAAGDGIGNGGTEMTSQGTGGIEVAVGTSIETPDGRTVGDPVRRVRMMRGTETGIGNDEIVTGDSCDDTLAVLKHNGTT